MSIYLDNSATTRVCAEAAEAMVRCMREEFYNPSALYAPALAAQKALRACRDELEKALSVTLPELSMGMSSDWPAAVACGSTLIRVGSAIFHRA